MFSEHERFELGDMWELTGDKVFLGEEVPDGG